jgi:predicted RNase H-like HicB family nuclease
MINMRTTALIEKGKDGTFGIFTPDIETTIIGEGTTVAEAKADFENSVQEIISAYREAGDELPAELKNIKFVYKYVGCNVEQCGGQSRKFEHLRQRRQDL